MKPSEKSERFTTLGFGHVVASCSPAYPSCRRPSLISNNHWDTSSLTATAANSRYHLERFSGEALWRLD